LLDLIGQRNPPELGDDRVLPVELLVRESCGAP